MQRSQTELVGWYPLVGRTGKMFQQSSENVRGSIKLKLQVRMSILSVCYAYIHLKQADFDLPAFNATRCAQ